MHEVELMQKMLNRAIDRAREEGGHRIYLMQMRVGEAAAVTPEALKLAFETVKKGTIAETAQLEIEPVPAVCYCPSCDLEFQPTEASYQCPQCHHLNIEVRQGQEFELACLEVS